MDKFEHNIDITRCGKRRTILYFGSFNPVHNGHTGIAEYILQHDIADNVWFIVSPQNPLKLDAALAPEQDRLEMTRIAVREKLARFGKRIHVSDIEFNMPRPSYTIDTLNRLTSDCPDCRFGIIIGTDIMEQFANWKEYREIISNFMIYVYPREGYGIPEEFADKVSVLKDAPRWNYSSSEIRQALAEGRDTSPMLDPGVENYIKEKRLYGYEK